MSHLEHGRNHAHPDPAVIIVAYGDPVQLEDCLKVLSAPPAREVVVVDNGLDERVSLICLRRGATYLRPSRNLGFAGGVNTGLRSLSTTGCDVLLLNPDARLSWDGVMALQTALHARPGLAAVTPLLRDLSGSPERAQWPMPSPAQVWLDAVGLGARQGRRQFLTGAVLMLNRTAVEQVGPFDERFFLYAEESDWQMRALLRGWSLQVVPDVVAVHAGGATSSDPAVRSKHFDRSAALFVQKWYPGLSGSVMRAGTRAAAARRRLQSAASRPRISFAGSSWGRAHLDVVHAIRSDSFAGVERYVVDVANGLALQGLSVGVVGGEAAHMRSLLAPAVRYRPASTTWGVGWELATNPARLVHAHMTAAELPAALLAPALGHRVVATRHFAAPRGGAALGRCYSRLLSPRFDLQISISNFVAAAVGERTVVLRNGVSDRSLCTARAPTVVMLQRLNEEKSPEVGLAAFALSRVWERGWRLVVAGRGGLDAALRRLAQDLAIEEAVDFLGFCDDPVALLSSAGVVLAPARAEPFGLVVAEAMATGAPVLASDAGAHAEVLGPAARLFPAGDVGACADALRELVADDALRASYGRDLHERQRRELRLDDHVQQLIRLYGDLAPYVQHSTAQGR